MHVLCVGHASYDLSMQVSAHPASNEKCTASAIQVSGGGPAANAAVCISRLGGRAAFCGYLGHDTFGEIHLQEFIRENVEVRWITRGTAASNVSQILAKPDGSRSVVNYREHDFLPAETPAPTPSDFGAILIDGHEPLLSLAIAQRAKHLQIPVIYDAGSLRSGSVELLQYVDYLVASETFSHQYTRQYFNQLAGQENDIQVDYSLSLSLKILSACCPSVIITTGENGLIWQHNNQQGVMPAFPVQTIDSTGAGDAFHAAFAYGITLKLPWEKLLRFASAAGALACTKLGARPAMPDLQALQSFLATSEQ
ncbi:MAG: hypothetical protein AUJ56_10415 [Zetaproteobacteria bacterium CG1_02_49_23]|nr:MAG: hypothetical protein AUJ56_10415 [Zetaproteobacteria bacterium CG1_02_49_23]